MSKTNGIRPTLRDHHVLAGEDLLVQFLGQIWHERVQQPQRTTQNGGGSGTGFARLITKLRFDQFDIPVTVGMPDKAVDGVRGLIEPVILDCRGHALNGLVILGDNPSVDRLIDRGKVEIAIAARAAIDLQKAAGIPYLGCKIAIAFKTCRRHFYVASLRGHGSQRETQRVGTVLVDQDERIHDVALRLRHLLALLVTDKGMDIDFAERHLVIHGVHAHHHHSGDPEEDDVKAGDKYVARVIARQIMLDRFGLVGPAKGREWPQTTGEPGVQNILVTPQFNVLAVMRPRRGQCRLVAFLDKNMIVGTIPGGNTMPPPELP